MSLPVFGSPSNSGDEWDAVPVAQFEMLSIGDERQVRFRGKLGGKKHPCLASGLLADSR